VPRPRVVASQGRQAGARGGVGHAGPGCGGWVAFGRGGRHVRLIGAGVSSQKVCGSGVGRSCPIAPAGASPATRSTPPTRPRAPVPRPRGPGRRLEGQASATRASVLLPPLSRARLPEPLMEISASRRPLPESPHAHAHLQAHLKHRSRGGWVATGAGGACTPSRDEAQDRGAKRQDRSELPPKAGASSHEHQGCGHRDRADHAIAHRRVRGVPRLPYPGQPRPELLNLCAADGWPRPSRLHR